MNNAMMNHAAGLHELTAQDVNGVAGGVGADPTLPKVSSSAGAMQIGADPLPPMRVVLLGDEPPRPK